MNFLEMISGSRLLLTVAVFCSFFPQVGAAQDLVNGDVVHGAISVPDEADNYTFTAVAGQYVWLRLADTNAADRMEPLFRIFGPDGLEIGSRNDDVRFHPALSGTYRVEVKDYGSVFKGTGPYDLYFNLAPGAREEGGLINGTGRSGYIDVGDIDSFTFYARAGHAIWLRLGDENLADQMQPGFRVIDPNGSQVNVAVTDVYIPAATEGTYTVLVGDFGSSILNTGPYVLHYVQVPGADDGGSLISGGTRFGSITTADIDALTFRAEGGEAVSVRVTDLVTGNRFMPAFRLVDPEGVTVANRVTTWSTSLAKAGTHTVLVSEYGNNGDSGDYSVSLTINRDRLSYAALGDSYSSGEGVIPYRDLADTTLDGCHRSTRAYPTLVRMPGNTTPISERSDGQFDFLACSGAKTENVRSGGTGQNGEPAQLSPGNAINSARDLLTISIGGNDAKFVPIVAFCLAHENCNGIKPFLPYSELTLGEFAPLLIEYVKANVLEVHQQIKAAAPNATSLVLGYPILLSGKECPDAQFPPIGDSVFKLSRSEQRFLRDMNAQLNTAVSDAASTAGLHFVPVADRFVGHEICGSKEPWINGVVLLNPTFNPKASVHPTARGQQEYANAVNAYLESTAKGWPYGYTGNGLPKNPPAIQRVHARAGTALPEVGELRADLPVVGDGCEKLGRVIVPGKEVRLRGDGFFANESVSLALVSGGLRFTLGTALASSGGVLDAVVTTPTELVVGSMVSIEALGAGANSMGRLLVTLAHVESSATIDGDGDGVPDLCDNCSAVANSDQRDTDRDGYGNACDADLDGNGVVDRQDRALMDGAQGTVGDALDADLDGNYKVDQKDLSIFKGLRGLPPGPAYETGGAISRHRSTALPDHRQRQ